LVIFKSNGDGQRPPPCALATYTRQRIRIRLHKWGPWKMPTQKWKNEKGGGGCYVAHLWSNSSNGDVARVSSFGGGQTELMVMAQ
jgi:hypothetical protein